MSYPPLAAYPPSPGMGVAPPGKVRLRGRIPRILGWTFLGLAVVLFIVGVVVVGTKSLSKVNGFQRVPVPTDNSTVRFDDTGTYVAYYEASDVDSGIREVPAVVMAMQAPDGSVMRITHGYKEHSDGKIDIFTYDYNGHKGVGLYEFTINQTGVYHVATRPTPSTASDAQIAFGKDISGGAVAGGVLVVIGIILGVAAIVLLIIGYVKRSNHKGELQRGQWGGVPAPAYGGQPPAGYGAPQGFAPPPAGYTPPPQQNPPPYNPPAYGEQPGYNPPAYGEQPGYNPPPAYGEQPGYNPPPAYGEQPGYNPPGHGQQPPPPPYGAPPAPADEPSEQPSFGDPTAPPKDDSADR